MTKLSLRDAAKEAGTSKTSILRAIKSGRLSAPRDDLGQYQIDPSELFRVYPPPSSTEVRADQRNSPGPRTVDQTVPVDGPTGPDATDQRTATMMAALEAEITGLREIIRRLDADKADLRSERDRWAAQAEAAQRLLAAPAAPSRGGLFGWLRRAS